MLENDKLRYWTEQAIDPDVQLLNELRANKKEIKNFLKTEGIQDNNRDVAYIPPIDNKEQKIPLSFAQERLWFIDKLSGSTNYHVPTVLHMDGKLHYGALEFSLKEIVNRHHVLRTVFAEESGTVFQYVLNQYNWNLPITDLSEHPGNLNDRISAVIAKPFDLSSDVVMRAQLFRMTESKHVLVVVIHHIAFDGASRGIFVSEAIELYLSRKRNSVPELPPLLIQYADYAYWQRTKVDSRVRERALTYWVDKLTGVATLDIPTDFTRPATQSGRGAAAYHTIDRIVLDKINAMAQQHDVTSYVFLLAVFKLFLYRYSREKDVCVGSPISNRVFRNVEHLIGFFVNTVALRTSLDNPDENVPLSFSELLQRVKVTTIDALRYQDAPFEKVIERVEKSRDMSRHPLFQVFFALHRDESSDRAPDDEIILHGVEPDNPTTQFDLTLNITESQNGLQLKMSFSTDLFVRERIERMLRMYEQLMLGVVEKIESPIDSFRLITDEEERLLLESLTSKPEPRNTRNIINILSEQMRTVPDKVAVTTASGSMTYRELDHYSNWIAKSILDKGIRTQSLIVICMDRSLSMIAGVVGILKAGSAYVPVDPDYPEERIRYIINDSDTPLVISKESLSAVFKTERQQNKLLLVDDDFDATSEQTGLPQVDINPDDIAYVIYTSGTTGRPKGALITHRNVVRLMIPDNPLFDFSSSDTWTLYHSFCFDFSVWEMYGALFFGGRLVVVSREVSRDPVRFSELIDRERVTVFNQTPSAFYTFQDAYCSRVSQSSVRYVIFGGEALRPSNLRRWSDLFRDCKLINMYGITETTVHVTFKEISQRDIEAGISNIGTPIPTLVCHVLGPSGEFLPDGIVGELYVAGEGLARGYLNQVSLTHERFVHRDFRGNNIRLYRTGDLAIRNNGSFEYKGRMDEQVKVRGFRIELGEIETVLEQLPPVSGAVVSVAEDHSGSKKLVAYIVPRTDVKKTEILEELRSRLPEYMVPGVIHFVSHLAITSNGKIDRKALPKIDERLADYLPPITETQATIASIWQDILGVPRISRDANFFNIGGDSIVLIRVVSRIREAFKKDVSLAQFYKSQTIEQIASIFDSQATPQQRLHLSIEEQEVAARVARLRIEVMAKIPAPNLVEDVIPMSDIQKGMVFGSLIDPMSGVYHDQMLNQLPLLEPLVLERALTLLTAKHPTLRTAFNITDFSEEAQIIYRHINARVEFIDISMKPANLQQQFINQYNKEELLRPFDFTVAPLWRATLFKVSSNRSVYVFQCYHGILDGWSVASLETELNNVYFSLLSDPGTVPTRLRVSYQEAILQGIAENLDASNVSFWKQKMDGYRRLQIFSSNTTNQSLFRIYDVDYLESVRKAAQHYEVSLNSFFLAACMLSLRALTYEKDITLGFVSNVRPVHEDGDKVLGCFLNTIPFRFQMPGREEATTLREYVRDIHASLIELRGRDRMTLYNISQVTGERSAGGNPFFDMIFNFVDFHVYDNLAEASPGDSQEEPGSLDLNSINFTNTFLDITTNVTSRHLSMYYVSRRRFSSSISLELFHQFFERALAILLGDPNYFFDGDQVLPASMRNTLLKFPRVNSGLKPEQTFVEMFINHARSQPNNIAVVCEGKHLTYREVDEQSNQLANFLLDLGTLKGEPVPVIGDRSPQMLIALIAILKCGGSYVPLDPGYPEERIHDILFDCAARTCIVSSEVLVRTRAWSPPSVVNIITNDLAQNSSSKTPQVEIYPDDLAYIIYTSGSTGKPKGAMIHHAGMANHLRAKINDLEMGPESRVAQNASHTFDISIWQFLSSLMLGGVTIIYSNEAIMDVPGFIERVETDRITILEVVPTYLRAMLDELASVEVRPLAGIKYFISTGEFLPKALVKRWFELYPGKPLVNAYGPTEASDDITHFIMRDIPASEIVPVGSTVNNLLITIVNDRMELLPTGVIGEICVSGVGVGRGYLNRVDLTAEKFIVSPFHRSQMLYRTGDFGRWLPDGNLEYLGRMDDQIKILGHRIETGEIENVAMMSGIVRQCLVIGKETNLKTKSLIAYIVPNNDYDVGLLRGFLVKKLPAYMIPASIIELSEFPVTANGKIDRKNLPDPSERITESIVGPADQVEESILSVWSNVLQMDASSISVTANFFELGGHSLSVTIMVSRLHKHFNIRLPLRTIFDQPTIRSIGALIKVMKAQPRDDSSQEKEMEKILL